MLSRKRLRGRAGVCVVRRRFPSTASRSACRDRAHCERFDHANGTALVDKVTEAFAQQRRPQPWQRPRFTPFSWSTKGIDKAGYLRSRRPDSTGIELGMAGQGQHGKVWHMAASEAQIAEVERHFGVRFPDDYRQFLLTRGTMGEFLPPANPYVTIYAVEALIPVNAAGVIQQRFPGAMVIGGDGSREMLTYDFRHDPAPLVLLDTAAENWSAAIHQASSLTALLAQLPERGWLFQ